MAAFITDSATAITAVVNLFGDLLTEFSGSTIGQIVMITMLVSLAAGTIKRLFNFI